MLHITHSTISQHKSAWIKLVLDTCSSTKVAVLSVIYTVLCFVLTLLKHETCAENYCLQAAAQASYFLPAYDSRQTAITITSLREQIDAAKKQQAGKKKFGFSKKGKQPPTEKIMSSQQTLMKHSQPQDASLSQPQQTVAPAHLRQA